MKEHYSIISTHELIRQIESGKIQNGAVALTFDDGYLDNFTTAKPLLEKYSVPATFFITDSYLGGQPFWWDELEAIIVHTDKLPSVLSVSFRNETINFNLGEDCELNEKIRSKQANFGASQPPTLRTKLYVKLWKLFSPLQKDDQIKLLKLVKEWAGLSEDDSQVEGTMSVQQLKLLSDNPLFTIGGHTSTHPALAKHTKDVQKKEIVENQNFLENCLDEKIRSFAYPSGNFNSSTIQILKERAFSAAFTTTSKPVVKKTDRYKIGRFQVTDLNQKNFERSLSNWLRK
ncbi:polysaccharide deacetylase family protein [Rhodohalobacter sp. SW132]|uniref:polysaccharide deacetylase family protein n=1 Tax=Rhodohalobacter sp. SW132 TaxID=2293433 RepID=UPI0013154196|nr:polysaccharide deacetylase family protein [Rhodohalobacter sp. SW132]